MTNTNFFTQVQQLEIVGNLHILISKGVDDNLVVAVLLKNEQCGDKAKNAIPPFTLTATAAALDQVFFEKITTPIKTISGLMVDMEGFLKQVEQAKMQSAMEKSKADTAKKEKEEKEKRYREAMAKADGLDKEGKHREAWVKVPDPAQYPEHAEAIDKRRRELSAKFSSPSLFGTDQ